MTLSYSAYRGRQVLTLRLKLKSPLHVGSGFHDFLTAHNGESEIASVVDDVDGKPYIPPTTLKGAVRALAGAAAQDSSSDIDSALVDNVFGTIKDDGGKGHPGWIILSGASLVHAGDIAGRIDVTKKTTVAPRILSKRTAIDDATGTAANNKLFQAHMVAPGAVFEMRVTIQRGDIDFINDRGIDLLLRALAALQTHGITVGRGKGDGNGLLKLEAVTALEQVSVRDGNVTVSRSDKPSNWERQINERGKFALDRAKKSYVCALKSNQPFAVLGSDEHQSTRENEKGQNNKLRALRRSAKVPELPGSSLMGVLRSRAEWFARLQALRLGFEGDAAEKHVLDCVQPLFGEDANSLKSERLVKAKRTGFAGKLRLHRVDVVKSTPIQVLDSVKIDRFSMGPFDSGLFGVEAFPKPEFEIALYLDERATDADIAFMNAFIPWLASDAPSAGLMLGHAVNRGFGWFTVTEKGSVA